MDDERFVEVACSFLFFWEVSSKAYIQAFENERKCLELKERVHPHSSLPYTPKSLLYSPPVDNQDSFLFS